MECIHLNFLTDNKGKKFLSPYLQNSDLNGKILKVIISDGSTKRVYPVFQQKGRHDPRQIPQGLPKREEVRVIALTYSKDRVRCVRARSLLVIRFLCAGH